MERTLPSFSDAAVVGGDGPQALKVQLSGRPDAAFNRLYDRLQALRDGRAHRARIIVWGDSHIAGEALVARLRQQLQQRLGDGGPGFVYLGRPWRSYRQLQVTLSESRNWRVERLWSHYSRRHPQPRDDLLGPGGISMYTTHTAWARIAARRRGDSFATADIHYLRQPGGGRVMVQTAGKRLRWIMTVGSEKEPAVAHVDLPRGTRQLELLTGATGEVRLFGVDLGSGKPGVVVDALGINGARASVIGKWNEALITEQLRHLAPDLVVLAYGSNEVDSDNLTPETFAAGFDDALRRMRRMAPDAACLVLGPPDQARYSREARRWEVPSRLDSLVEQQRRVASLRGCAFWDQRGAMGGSGAIFNWVRAAPPLARPDHVHLSWAGYRQIADALFDALVQGWTEHRGSAPSAPISRQ